MEYRGGRQANGEVYGVIRKAANGEVAQLYAQPFPYNHAPAQADSVILHPALQAEVAKPWYPYFGINLSTGKVPPTPKWLMLDAGSGHATASHRISANEFSETVTFSFQIGNDAYSWDWTTCAKDTEAQDGIGLPGHNGCGDGRVLDSAPYLG